jgi:hypothetical protein
MAAGWSYPGVPLTANQPVISHRAPHISSTESTGPIRPSACALEIIQVPSEALVSKTGKGRRAIDPPPIVQLFVTDRFDPHRQWHQNPHVFMRASLTKEDDSLVEQSTMMGLQVSSLNRLKDNNNCEGGYFIFGDISIKTVGTFKLKFTLYELLPEMNAVQALGEISSKPFKCVPLKDYRGPEKSTYLCTIFADQGVRLRLRKEKKQSPKAAAGTKRGRESSEAEAEEVPQPEAMCPPPKRMRMENEEGRVMMAALPHQVQAMSANYRTQRVASMPTNHSVQQMAAMPANHSTQQVAPYAWSNEVFNLQVPWEAQNYWSSS